MEGLLSSAAAFVEGGIQDACDEACSICLEAFCDSDPSAVTNCKHEFHLQCILEWCQRSAQCPMCWQNISLKDSTSQELLEAVERERSIRSNQTRSASIFHHPALGDFEMQHLPVGVSDAELEERIIQHLAAAAAMGRAHNIARREGRGRLGNQGHQQFMVFSTHPDTASTGSPSANSSQRGENELHPSAFATSPSPLTGMGEGTPHHIQMINPTQDAQATFLPSGTMPTMNRRVIYNNRNAAGQSTPVNQDSAGPSDFQSFSESLKSRLNAVSTRYKESITKSTRGWKERLFSRGNSVADLGSEVRREVNAGIATVSRMMERLDTRESRRTFGSSSPHHVDGHSVTEPSNERVTEIHTQVPPRDINTPASGSSDAIIGQN